MREQGIVACLSFALLLVAGCTDRGERPKPPAPAAKPVRVAVVSSAEWPRSLHVIGSLEAHERAELSTKIQGRVAAVLVDVGARLDAGAPVARLDPTDLQLELARAEAALSEARAQLGLGLEGATDGEAFRPEDAPMVKLARAQLDEARANRERQLALKAEKVASQSAIDAAEAAFRAAQSRLEDAFQELERRRATLHLREAELALARQRLADTEIVAPFAGVVLTRDAAPGDVLAPGSAIATLINVDPLRLRATVPERSALEVRTGQRVLVRVEGMRTPFEARIDRVSPELEPATRMLTVEADVRNANGALRAGTFCQVEVIIDEAAQALTIPPDAIRTFAGLDKVLVVVGGKAIEKRIGVGRREANRVEVRSGLEGGEQIVLESGGLASGTPVEPTLAVPPKEDDARPR